MAAEDYRKELETILKALDRIIAQARLSADPETLKSFEQMREATLNQLASIASPSG